MIYEVMRDMKICMQLHIYILSLGGQNSQGLKRFQYFIMEAEVFFLQDMKYTMEENFDTDETELNNIDIYLNAPNKCEYTENVVNYVSSFVQEKCHIA